MFVSFFKAVFVFSLMVTGFASSALAQDDYFGDNVVYFDGIVTVFEEPIIDFGDLFPTTPDPLPGLGDPIIGFGTPASPIEFELDDIFDVVIKPILEEKKDDILDTLGIDLPENFADGIDWISDNPVGGGIIIGGAIGAGIFGVESGLIDSIPLPDIEVLGVDYPNGVSIDINMGLDIGVNNDFEFGGVWEASIGIEVKR